MRHFENLLLAIKIICRRSGWRAVQIMMEGDIPECLLLPVEDTVANFYIQVELLSGSDAEQQETATQQLPAPDLQPESEEPERDSVSPDKNTSVGTTNNTDTQTVVKAKRSLSVVKETPTSRKTRSSGRRGGSSKQCTEYVVRFKGNQSAKWDGKEIVVDGDWLEELYAKDELCTGRIVQLPWESKKGKSVDWKVMIVSAPGLLIQLSLI